MKSFRHVEAAVFAELSGFVLVNPTRLNRLVRDRGLGSDVLAQFTSSDLGDHVCEAGIVVPVVGVTAEYYEVCVRCGGASSLRRVARKSSGWVFEADEQPSILCGIGYLAHWNAKRQSHRRIAVPPGTYSVTFAAGFLGGGSNRWGIDFALTAKPHALFSADPGAPFDCYLDESASRGRTVR